MEADAEEDTTQLEEDLFPNCRRREDGTELAMEATEVAPLIAIKTPPFLIFLAFFFSFRIRTPYLTKRIIITYSIDLLI